jgi:serine/threonine protein kinase
MPALFISYRRSDSPDTVKLIHERLKRRLPRWEIFYDHESIPLGEQFPERLRAKVASAAVVLVIIGPRWLEILQERKSATVDHVRAEVRLALEAGTSVVPVLVGHAAMPTEADLAEFADLQPLLRRNGRPVRPDPDFDGDLEPIIAHIKQLDSDEAVGATLADKYTLTAEIGHGGMGVVFLAEQKQPVRRTVAVKLIKPGMDTRDVLARFDAERQALAVMDHPNIARVLDAGMAASGRPFFVMEYVRGVPITQYCDEKKLTPQERLNLFIPVCNAVQHAHQKGIIHRDLKPSNVLVEVVDGKPVPKVIDFGLAKALGQKLTDKTLYTALDTRVGTLEYSAPEQAAGRSFDVDTRSDIYSLGVMLYELLTGAPPFTHEELLKIGEEEMRRVIREKEPTKPSKKLSSSGELPAIAANRHMEPNRLTRLVKGDLDWIVMKCLEKERDRRYKNANDIGEELQRFLADEPVQAGPPSAAYRLRKFVRRHKAGLLTATGVLLATALGAAIAFWQITNALEGEKNANILAGQRLETVERQKTDVQDALEKKNRAQADLQAQLSLAVRVYCERSDVEFQRGNVPDSLKWMLRAYEAAKQANDPLERSYRHLLADQSQVLNRTYIHAGPIVAVAFSPDGRAVLTGSQDKTARLWDAATGKARGAPLRHEGEVWAVAFSPDGRTVLTGSRDGTARLWDAAAGAPRGRPLRHEGAVRAVAFNPDGHTILTASGSTARLWDAATGKARGEPLRHEGPVTALAFSPDGHTILTASGNTARLWEVVELAPDDLDRLRAWVRVRTGKAFDDQGVLRQLSQADWLQALKDLEAHGGDWQAKPSGRRWHFIEADDAIYSQQWFAAEFHLRRLLADPPNRAEPYPAAERVVELAEQLQKGNPGGAAPLEILGATLFRAARYPDALARLNEAVEQQKHGGNVWTQLFLAMTHHRLGDSAKAKDWLRRADAEIKKREDDKDAPINRQERLRDQKLRQEAADLLNSSP